MQQPEFQNQSIEEKKNHRVIIEESGCCAGKDKESKCCKKEYDAVVNTEAEGGCCKDTQCSKNQSPDSQPAEGYSSKPQISYEEFRKWVKIAFFLSLFTIIWNIGEGVVSILFGIEEETIALSIFGGDSLIEVASGIVVFWRFRTEFAQVLSSKGTNTQDMTVNTEVSAASIQKERIATRVIGFLLFGLGLVAIAGSTLNLFKEQGADSSVPGILISGISISFMFFLYYFKLKAAKVLNNNKTLLADAKCSLSCIVLSFVLFLGSLAGIISDSQGDKWELWWIDAAITIVMAIIIIKEGLQAFIHSFSKDFQGGCPCCVAN